MTMLTAVLWDDYKASHRGWQRSSYVQKNSLTKESSRTFQQMDSISHSNKIQANIWWRHSSVAPKHLIFTVVPYFDKTLMPWAITAVSRHQREYRTPATTESQHKAMWKLQGSYLKFYDVCANAVLLKLYVTGSFHLKNSDIIRYYLWSQAPACTWLRCEGPKTYSSIPFRNKAVFYVLLTVHLGSVLVNNQLDS